MYKIAMFFDKNLSAPFELSGVEVFSSKDKEAIRTSLEKINSEGNYEIIFVPENIAKENEDEINKYPQLNIVLIPDISVESGFFMDFLGKITIKATGE